MNIIFDFDGTIADSLPLVIRLFERMMRGGKPMPPGEVDRLRGMSLAHAGAELRIPPWKAPLFLARGRRMMRRHLDEVPIFPGIVEVIRQLQQDGHQLYVVSSNSARNIRIFLKRHELDNVFVHIKGSAGIFGKKKLLRDMLHRSKLVTGDTLYIGDEVRDIDAAHHCGIRIIAVTWGYNNHEIIQKHKPNFVADKPADILGLVSADA